ncbi:MAG: alpha/beta fold hydrolase [Pseudomonadota bacterium]|jgi:pimeloyl-ACP methyl ester carboxylesterase
MSGAAPAALTPQQVAHIFLTPQRGKAKTPEALPPGARALSLPFEQGHIAAWEWGQGPAVLLVHGWQGTHADLECFVQPLADAGFRVVGLDLPGHGASSGKLAPIPLLARAVRHVSDTVAPLHGIIAHSIGCAAAVTAMTRGLQPRRAVLLASPSSYRNQANLVARMINMDRAKWPEFEAELDALGSELGEIDFFAMAPRLTVPALVMHSDDDQMLAMENARDATALWKGAVFRELKGLGHWKLLADPGVIADAVAFLKDG